MSWLDCILVSVEWVGLVGLREENLTRVNLWSTYTVDYLLTRRTFKSV